MFLFDIAQKALPIVTKKGFGLGLEGQEEKIKDEDQVNQKYLKAFNLYVFQQTGQKDYFKEGVTWGDVKKGFTQLGLNFDNFLKWYQLQLEQQNKEKSKPSGTGRSVAVSGFIAERRHKQEEEIAERTEEIKKKHGRPPFDPDVG